MQQNEERDLDTRTRREMRPNFVWRPTKLRLIPRRVLVSSPFAQRRCRPRRPCRPQARAPLLPRAGGDAERRGAGRPRVGDGQGRRRRPPASRSRPRRKRGRALPFSQRARYTLVAPGSVPLRLRRLLVPYAPPSVRLFLYASLRARRSRSSAVNPTPGDLGPAAAPAARRRQGPGPRVVVRQRLAQHGAAPRGAAGLPAPLPHPTHLHLSPSPRDRRGTGSGVQRAAE